jgi:cell division protein FtsL
MPLWAIFYCTVIVFSALLAISVFYKRGNYYVPGQLLSSLFSVMMFFYYYDVFFHKPDSVIIVITMFCYILYWECWENRNLFPTKENKKNDSYKSKLDFIQRPVVSEKMFMPLMVIIVVVSLPLIYTTCSLVMSYY